ncbi:hypothetical protein [Falsiroseomonas stagni]|uniref:Uncharacterized protein n=1 Tax=Falsiroseomonas stagni DSM 19981 TaxID=1123062 RepID=A0A1I4CQH1_9PROT|nr:hypothetical protein [Falsiroseomonas stagni]SFK82306.1 hypothetical protein SAMN02745775_10813 [Falsiroseomonas stagni DSM 19981]
MERRRFLLAGLAGTLARPADAARSTPPPEMTRPEELLLGDVEATVEDIQYGPPGRGRGRRHRCRIETRRVPFRDRRGRLRYRILEREVCR